MKAYIRIRMMISQYLYTLLPRLHPTVYYMFPTRADQIVAAKISCEKIK